MIHDIVKFLANKFYHLSFTAGWCIIFLNWILKGLFFLAIYRDTRYRDKRQYRDKRFYRTQELEPVYSNGEKTDKTAVSFRD